MQHLLRQDARLQALRKCLRRTDDDRIQRRVQDRQDSTPPTALELATMELEPDCYGLIACCSESLERI